MRWKQGNEGLGSSGNVSGAPPPYVLGGWVGAETETECVCPLPSPPGRSNGENRTRCLMRCTATRCSPIWTLSTSLAAKAATGEAAAWSGCSRGLQVTWLPGEGLGQGGEVPCSRFLALTHCLNPTGSA